MTRARARGFPQKTTHPGPRPRGRRQGGQYLQSAVILVDGKERTVCYSHMARETGLHRSTISKLFRRPDDGCSPRQPTLSAALKISNYLGISPHQLLAALGTGRDIYHKKP